VKNWSIKEYFKILVDVFWLDDHHIANKTKQKESALALVTFFFPPAH